MNNPLMLLIAFALAGCASAPRQLPRATAHDLATADDKSVCLAGNLYPHTHADAAIVNAEYVKRLKDGRFTNEQCIQFYARLMRDKQQAEEASAAVWNDVAYQFGQAIGSRGRAITPQTASPYSRPQAQPAPAQRPILMPVVPYVPQPMAFAFHMKTPDPGSAPWFATCSYMGTTTTIRIQLYQQCPASVAQ